MGRKQVALLLLIVIVSAMFLACGGDKPGRTKFTGTLTGWDIDRHTITVDGVDYTVAEGMEKNVDKAETGRVYEFTRDVHGSIVEIHAQ